MLWLISLSYIVLMKAKAFLTKSVLLSIVNFFDTVWWKLQTTDIGTVSSFGIADDICKVFFNIKLVFFLHRRYRYIAYQQFVWWIFGVLGKKIRVPTPSCVVTTICMKFPVDAGESFEGFHYIDKTSNNEWCQLS